MSGLSAVVLVGNLTRDSQLKYTANGFPIGSFSVAVNIRKKSGDQWVDEAHFFDVDVLGKTAEALNQYLTKGKLVAIDGELRQDRWEQDGQQRSKVKVLANQIRLLGGGHPAEQSPHRETATQPEQARERRETPENPGAEAVRKMFTQPPETFDDDIF